MAAQGLHNQLQKPCLLSFPVSSPLATMIPCPVLELQDAPSVRQASLHHTTHEKLTSGSNALLAPTQKVPPHNVQGCCLCAWVLAKQCTSSRSSTTYNVSKCGQQLPSAYAHTCAPTCVHTSFASSWHTHAAAAHALHHLLHVLQFKARPRPAPKCKVRKGANIVSVKLRRTSCRY